MVDDDVAVVAMLEHALVGVGVGPGGLDERDRMAGVVRDEVDGVSHRLPVRLLRRVLLAIGLSVLAADGVLVAGEIAQRAVAGAVDEDVGGQLVAGFRRHLIALDALDFLPVGVDLVHRRVHEQGQVPGLACAGPKHAVPEGEVVGVVDPFVLQLQLHQDAGLGGILLSPVATGAGDVHPRLAACVSSEDGPVVDQRGLRAMARACHRGAQSAHAATDHHDVEMLPFSRILGGGRSFMDKLFHIACLFVKPFTCYMPDTLS